MNVSSTWFPNTAICTRCGKPEHGSLACEYAPGWPKPPEIEMVATNIDPSAPGGPLDRIADALTRIAAALEVSNQERKP